MKGCFYIFHHDLRDLYNVSDDDIEYQIRDRGQ